MYILYVGFRLLGKFASIWEAKKYAQNSNLSGVFNLIGDNYRDAWYVPIGKERNNIETN